MLSRISDVSVWLSITAAYAAHYLFRGKIASVANERVHKGDEDGTSQAILFGLQGSSSDIQKELEKRGYIIYKVLSSRNNEKDESWNHIVTIGLSIEYSRRLATMHQIRTGSPSIYDRLLQLSFSSIQRSAFFQFEKIDLLHSPNCKFPFGVMFPTFALDIQSKLRENFGLKLSLQLCWLDHFCLLTGFSCFIWYFTNMVLSIHQEQKAIHGLLFAMWMNIVVQMWKGKLKGLVSVSQAVITSIELNDVDLYHCASVPYERSRVIWVLLSVFISLSIFALQILVSIGWEYVGDHTTMGPYYIPDILFYLTSSLLAYCLNKWSIPWRLHLESHSTARDKLAAIVQKKFVSQFGIFLARVVHLLCRGRTSSEMELAAVVLLLTHFVLRELKFEERWHRLFALPKKVSAYVDTSHSVDASIDMASPLDAEGRYLVEECHMPSLDQDNHATTFVTTVSICIFLASLAPAVVPLLTLYLLRKRAIMWDQLLRTCRRPQISDEGTMHPWLPLLEKMTIVGIIANVGFMYVAYSSATGTGTAGSGSTSPADSDAGASECGAGAVVNIGANAIQNFLQCVHIDLDLIAVLFILEHLLIVLHLLILPKLISLFFYTDHSQHHHHHCHQQLSSSPTEIPGSNTWTALETVNRELLQYKQALEKLSALCEDSSPSVNILKVLFEQHKLPLANLPSLQTDVQLARVLEHVAWSMPPFAVPCLTGLPYFFVDTLRLPWWAALLPIFMVCAFHQSKIDQASKAATVSPVSADPDIVNTARQRLPEFLYDRDVQRCEWMNLMLRAVWRQMSEFAYHKIQEKASEVFEKINSKSSLISVAMARLELGDNPPTILGIRVLNGLSNQDHMEMDVNFAWISSMRVDIGITLFGAHSVTVGVSNFVISGQARMLLHPLIPAVPPFRFADVSFQGYPDIDFSLNVLGHDIMDYGFSSQIGGSVSSLVHHVVRQVIGLVALYPKAIRVQLESNYKDEITEKKQIEIPQGIVCLKVVSCDVGHREASELLFGELDLVFTLQEQQYHATNVLPSKLNSRMSPIAAGRVMTGKADELTHAFMVSHLRADDCMRVTVYSKIRASQKIVGHGIIDGSMLSNALHRRHIIPLKSTAAGAAAITQSGAECGTVTVELKYVPLAHFEEHSQGAGGSKARKSDMSSSTHDDVLLSSTRNVEALFTEMIMHDPDHDEFHLNLLMNSSGRGGGLPDLTRHGSVGTESAADQSVIDRSIHSELDGSVSRSRRTMVDQSVDRSRTTADDDDAAIVDGAPIVRRVTKSQSDIMRARRQSISMSFAAQQPSKKQFGHFGHSGRFGPRSTSILTPHLHHDAFAHVAGVLTVSAITVRKLRAAKTLLSQSHFYHSYVTFMLGHVKQKTMVAKKKPTVVFEESFNFIVGNVEQDTLVVKLKQVTDLGVHVEVASFKIRVRTLLKQKHQEDGTSCDWSEHLEKDVHMAMGSLHCNLLFRVAEGL